MTKVNNPFKQTLNPPTPGREPCQTTKSPTSIHQTSSHYISIISGCVLFLFRSSIELGDRIYIPSQRAGSRALASYNTFAESWFAELRTISPRERPSRFDLAFRRSEPFIPSTIPSASRAYSIAVASLRKSLVESASVKWVVTCLRILVAWYRSWWKEQVADLQG